MRIDLSIPTTVLLFAVLFVMLPHVVSGGGAVTSSTLKTGTTTDERMFQFHSSRCELSARTARESAAGCSLAPAEAASEDGAAVTSKRSSPAAAW